MAVTRRILVWSAAGFAGVAALGGAMALLLRFSQRPLGTDPAIHSASVLAARSLGREYLRLSPEEADPAVLLEKLVRRGAMRDGGSSFLRALERAVRLDFEGGKLVRLDGWILSTSEARFYALLTFV